jgi:hypothetical protein
MDEILTQLNVSMARYLLIGGQAVRLFGMPRFSMDWDFFIPPRDIPNFVKLNNLLESEIDIPLTPLGAKGEGFVQTYQTQHGVLQFHLVVPGVRSFEEAEQDSVEKHTELGTPVRCLSPEHMLRAKEAINRPQDAQDILFLRELLRSES